MHTPLARTKELIIEALPSETIVYDTINHRVHCLNETASLIWQHCDGQTSVEQIANRASQRLRAPADEDVVRLGLRELNDRGLLVSEPGDAPTVSRREVGKRLAVFGGAFVALLPVITSIVAPTPAMAASQGDSHGNGNGNGNGEGNGNGNGNGQGNG
jgi:hypothetical protein